MGTAWQVAIDLPEDNTATPSRCHGAHAGMGLLAVTGSLTQSRNLSCQMLTPLDARLLVLRQPVSVYLRCTADTLTHLYPIIRHKMQNLGLRSWLMMTVPNPCKK